MTSYYKSVAATCINTFCSLNAVNMCGPEQEVCANTKESLIWHSVTIPVETIDVEEKDSCQKEKLQKIFPIDVQLYKIQANGTAWCSFKKQNSATGQQNMEEKICHSRCNINQIKQPRKHHKHCFTLLICCCITCILSKKIAVIKELSLFILALLKSFRRSIFLVTQEPVWIEWWSNYIC